MKKKSLMRLLPIAAALLMGVAACNDINEAEAELIKLDKDVILFTDQGGRDSVWSTNHSSLRILNANDGTDTEDPHYYYPLSHANSADSARTDTIWHSANAFLLSGPWFVCSVTEQRPECMRIALRPNESEETRGLSVYLSNGSSSRYFTIVQAGKGQTIE
ncbi:MAG: hypothetical protein IJ244_01085 [Bacteroidaceae bacterium]|nr:hypothetical protein [Bacteroidaceae bacterium]